MYGVRERGYEGLGFTRWESSGALGDPSPRRRGHSGEEITGAREAPVEEGKEMEEAEGDGVSGGPAAGQAGVCRAWKAWQGLKGHRDAASERGLRTWEISGMTAGSGITEPRDSSEGGGVRGRRSGPWLVSGSPGWTEAWQGHRALTVLGPGGGGGGQVPRAAGVPGLAGAGSPGLAVFLRGGGERDPRND